MFTGIVLGTGVVADLRKHAGGLRLSIEARALAGPPKLGDSICVSGVCLTVAGISAHVLEFDVVKETLEKTTLCRLRPQDRVNLEPSLRVGDRVDGHFVQGHVDGTATVARVVVNDGEHILRLSPQQHILPYIIPKGSVAVDGVSLTVAALEGESFSIALIPTTFERTTLGELRQGDLVNIESDMMVRTIVHYLRQLQGHESFQVDPKNHGPRFDAAEPGPLTGKDRTSDRLIVETLLESRVVRRSRQEQGAS